MKKIKFKKGQHKTRPIRFKMYFNRDRFYFDFIIPSSFKPKLGTVDDGDWSKLQGITFDRFFRSRYNSVMLGFRYYNNKLQISPYLHGYKGARVFTEGWDIEFNKKYTCYIDSKGNIEVFGNNKNFVFKNKTTKIKKNFYSRLINTWYGGNKRSPINGYIFVENPRALD